MSAWLSIVRMTYSHRVLLGLGMGTKLLHHFAISSTPKGTIISCCCNLSFLKILVVLVVHRLHAFLVFGVYLCHDLPAVKTYH